MVWEGGIRHNFLDVWRGVTAVINWFKSIENKKQFSFICFDIEEFYPSISQDLLNKALDFAFNYDNITIEERNIIIHAKNSILIHKHIPWQKKGNATFDVTTTATGARTSSENVTFCFCNRELKQPRRRRQQKPHKFAYLTMENSIFARFARAYFIYWHFEDVLVLSTTWNDLFCSCVDDVSIWWQMFNFVFLCPKRLFQFNSRTVRTHFSSITTLNN